MEVEGKNKNYVAKEYELENLLNDLEKLIPKEEVMKIAGKDKRNFKLILNKKIKSSSKI